MPRRHSKPILAAVIAATVAASSPALAADAAQCEYAARQWAASVPHMSHRVKVPVWIIVGTLVGGPRAGLWMGVLASNAESPRERRMIASYTQWCMAGSVGEPPGIPPRWLELF